MNWHTQWKAITLITAKSNGSPDSSACKGTCCPAMARGVLRASFDSLRHRYLYLTISKLCYNYCFLKKHNKVIIIPSKKRMAVASPDFSVSLGIYSDFLTTQLTYPISITNLLLIPLSSLLVSIDWDSELSSSNLTLACLPVPISEQHQQVGSRPVDLSLEWLLILHPLCNHC